jgi:hypothetical protein
VLVINNGTKGRSPVFHHSTHTSSRLRLLVATLALAALSTVVAATAGASTKRSSTVTEDGRTLFYDATSGAGATGYFDIYGTWHQKQTFTNFRPGWNLITMAEARNLVFYASSSGRTSFDQLNDDGSISDLSDPTLASGWTAVAEANPLPFDVFYNQSTGTGVTGYNSSSVYIPLRPFAVARGYTDVVPIGYSNVLFLNRSTGAVATANVDSEGYLHPLKSGSVGTGWTHVVDVGYNEILLYNAASGSAEWAEIDDTGYFVSIKQLPRFTPGWTAIAPAGISIVSGGDNHQRVLFYKASTGYASVGEFDASGTYKNLKNYTFRTGWTHIATATW